MNASYFKHQPSTVAEFALIVAFIASTVVMDEDEITRKDWRA